MGEQQPPFEHEGSTTRRLDRVESDVAALTTAVIKVESGLQNVSTVLSRIETSISANEGREERERIAKQPKTEAIVAILVTLILALIAGAWQISGTTATLHERSVQNADKIKALQSDFDELRKEHMTP